MNREEILNLLESKTYDFLRENEHLKDRILFLCLGGSHAYGTNTKDSDLDIRGVALDTEDDILGITSFEQFQNKETDTVIYSFSKFIKLVSDCNPNVLEMLFCREDHYFYVSALGQLILNNRHIFLSQKAKYTFAGYAQSQLNRLENYLARDGEIIPEEKIKEHVNRSVRNCIYSFKDRYEINDGDIKTYVDKNKDGIYQIYADFDMKRVPLSSIREMIGQMTDIIKDYEKTIGQRNKKETDKKLNKHMMHLIRLYLMAIEILEKGDLHTYRESDHELLMDIREGKYRTEEGGVKDGFYVMLNNLKEKLDDVALNSKLSKNIQREKINFLYREILIKGVFTTINK